MMTLLMNNIPFVKNNSDIGLCKFRNTELTYVRLNSVYSHLARKNRCEKTFLSVQIVNDF